MPVNRWSPPPPSGRAVIDPSTTGSVPFSIPRGEGYPPAVTYRPQDWSVAWRGADPRADPNAVYGYAPPKDTSLLNAASEMLPNDLIAETKTAYKDAAAAGGVPAGVSDAALNVMNHFRYGVGTRDKTALEGSKIPGKPSAITNPDEAKRYVSNMLGAKKWGTLPADVLNMIAPADLAALMSGQMSWDDFVRMKTAGARGAALGAGVPGANPNDQPATVPEPPGRARR